MSGTICSTKIPCEDVFGDAMDKGKRANKNCRIKNWSLYYTMCNSEHARNLPSVPRPDLSLANGAESDVLPTSIFDVTASEPHVDICLDKLKGTTTWKPAGPAANWRSTAATALILWIEAHDYQYDVLCHVWQTKLLGEYQVYEHIATSASFFQLRGMGQVGCSGFGNDM